MSDTTRQDPLLDELIQRDLLTSEQIQEVQEEHERTRKSIRELIVDMEVLAEDQLLEIIAGYLGSHIVDLKTAAIPPDVIRSLPTSVARMYNILPIEADPDSVVLATSELLSPEIIDELRFVLTRDVTFVVTSAEYIRAALNDHYGDASESVSDMLSALEVELEDAGSVIEAGGKEGDEINLEEAANLAPVVRFVNLVLYQAVQDRASDIHFGPFENDFRIRYRVDGALYEMAPPPKHLALPVISRIKVVSGLNIAERRLPQDGQIQVHMGGTFC